MQTGASNMIYERSYPFLPVVLDEVGEGFEKEEEEGPRAEDSFEIVEEGSAVGRGRQVSLSALEIHPPSPPPEFEDLHDSSEDEGNDDGDNACAGPTDAMHALHLYSRLEEDRQYEEGFVGRNDAVVQESGQTLTSSDANPQHSLKNLDQSTLAEWAAQFKYSDLQYNLEIVQRIASCRPYYTNAYQFPLILERAEKYIPGNYNLSDLNKFADSLEDHLRGMDEIEEVQSLLGNKVGIVCVCVYVCVC